MVDVTYLRPELRRVMREERRRILRRVRLNRLSAKHAFLNRGANGRD